jgi:hypothetical protein
MAQMHPALPMTENAGKKHALVDFEAVFVFL